MARVSVTTLKRLDALERGRNAEGMRKECGRNAEGMRCELSAHGLPSSDGMNGKRWRWRIKKSCAPTREGLNLWSLLKTCPTLPT